MKTISDQYGLGFPRNSPLAQQFRGFAQNDFLALNSASFSYQYETSFSRNCASFRNK